MRAGKGSWISIHRSFWKTLMCKLLFPQSKHSWWCVHPSCFLLKSPTSLFVIQCIATIFILKLGTILVATFISDHTQDFLFKKILLTWAACITSHCIWWHLQSKTLTFRQLENSPFGIWTFTTKSKTSFVVSNSFLRYIYIYHFDNRPFENVLIYCNLHNYIRDMSQHLPKQSSQCVDFLRCFQGPLQRWNLMTRSRENFQRNFFAITLEISPMQ